MHTHALVSTVDHCRQLATALWQDARLSAQTRGDRLSVEPNVARLAQVLGVLIAREAKALTEANGSERLVEDVRKAVVANNDLRTRLTEAQHELSGARKQYRDLHNGQQSRLGFEATKKKADEQLAKCVESQLKLSEKLKDANHICASLREENKRMAAELAAVEKYRKEHRKHADEIESRVTKTMADYRDILR